MSKTVTPKNKTKLILNKTDDLTSFYNNKINYDIKQSSESNGNKNYKDLFSELSKKDKILSPINTRNNLNIAVSASWSNREELKLIKENSNIQRHSVIITNKSPSMVFSPISSKNNKLEEVKLNHSQSKVISDPLFTYNDSPNKKISKLRSKEIIILNPADYDFKVKARTNDFISSNILSSSKLDNNLLVIVKELLITQEMTTYTKIIDGDITINLNKQAKEVSSNLKEIDTNNFIKSRIVNDLNKLKSESIKKLEKIEEEIILLEKLSSPIISKRKSHQQSLPPIPKPNTKFLQLPKINITNSIISVSPSKFNDTQNSTSFQLKKANSKLNCSTSSFKSISNIESDLKKRKLYSTRDELLDRIKTTEDQIKDIGQREKRKEKEIKIKDNLRNFLEEFDNGGYHKKAVTSHSEHKSTEYKLKDAYFQEQFKLNIEKSKRIEELNKAEKDKIQKEREINYNKSLDTIKQRAEKRKEELAELKSKWSKTPIKKNVYLFTKLQEEDQRKKQLEEEEFKSKLINLQFFFKTKQQRRT